ncbi:MULTISPECIES: phosphotransferase [Pseudomonas]|uniref:phosphotransferase n=1 Tax=Pseudomonas TaxID=286 RepID=UPI001E32927D|nr:phosphotransferase [Pseudomonas alloputida]MCE1058294.1 phosphotransferase [Pseudomonas alloputida]
MIVINSAAYVVPEFRAEFGRIPPCLLPIGNRKLVEYQVPLLRKAYSERIIVSLPVGYELTIDEQRLFADLNIEPTYVPVDFTLAEALLYVLNTVGEPTEPLRLLHGDTLLEEIPEGVDLIGTAATEDDYSWETEVVAPGLEVVWCGYFAFASTQVFIRSLALAQGDFVKAVRLYSSQNTLTMVEVNGWHDLGHVNTYFVSRSRITTQRVFNSLRIQNGVVWKSGTERKKIIAEGEWFKKLPVPLRRYIPQLIDSGIDRETGDAFYMLEYLTCSPLNEVFVHGRNPDFFWRRIFNLMGEFLSDARHCVMTESAGFCRSEICADAVELYKNKTYIRLQQYSDSCGVSLDAPASYGDRELPSIWRIAEECISRTLDLSVVPTILHGDFCLSNILFDSRGGAIKVIDPRGLNQNYEVTLLGDQKYDLAKACHSLIGLYDFIIAGRYQIDCLPGRGAIIRFSADDRLLSIQKIFMESQLIPGISVADIMPLTVLLFLSMLPLHHDRPDRQEAMLINALRLYAEYVI